VSDLMGPLLAISTTQAQIDFLTDTILLNSLPRYEWTVEWNDYIKTPNDAGKETGCTNQTDLFPAIRFPNGGVSGYLIE
jgi:hypothetical protein